MVIIHVGIKKRPFSWRQKQNCKSFRGSWAESRGSDFPDRKKVISEGSAVCDFLLEESVRWKTLDQSYLSVVSTGPDDLISQLPVPVSGVWGRIVILCWEMDDCHGAAGWSSAPSTLMAS